MARDLAEVIGACEKAREEAVKEMREGFSREAPAMTKEDERLGMGLLTDPALLSRVVSDMERLGYVGEETNKALGYLVSVSRKLPAPLSAVVVSRSAAGKSALLRLIERVTPPEEVFSVSSLTPESLFYVPAGALKHRLLLIEERHGSEPADYSIRELQTRHVIRKAMPAKDPATGRMRTVCLEAEGPVAVLETTTAPESIHPENANRAFLLHVDESAEQTGRVLVSQRRGATLAGRKRSVGEEEIVRAHHAAQRLLRSLPVVIPFAERIEFPVRRLRHRRDQARFLSLIQAVACLYQYQRAVKESEVEGERMKYIEATVADYEAAQGLVREVFASQADDLSPLARRLLEEIRGLVKAAGGAATAGGATATDGESVTFTRRGIREATGWGDDQVKRHIRELLELEYLALVRGSPRGRHVYRMGEDAVSSLSSGEIPSMEMGL